MSDTISRQAAIDAIEKAMCEDGFRSSTGLIHKTTAYEIIRHLPSAQLEQLTDAEQRIFLKAIEREEKVCKKVDEEWGSGDEECEINLVHACHEIIRKVKGALWI